MSEFYTIVTNKGLAELQSCLSENRAFNAAYIAVGDSAGSYYEPEKEQTALKNEVYRAQIYAKGKRDNYLYFDLQLPPSEGNYVIREAGLFDSEGNMLAAAKYPETLKTKADADNVTVLNIELQIELSGDAINTIVVNEAGNLITMEQLKDFFKSVKTADYFYFSAEDWIEAENGFYRCAFDNIYAVTAVYKTSGNKKKLIFNADAVIENNTLTLEALQPFDGSFLGIEAQENDEIRTSDYFYFSIEDWEKISDDLYIYTADNISSVSAVYEIRDGRKKLIFNTDVTIENDGMLLESPKPYDGCVFGVSLSAAEEDYYEDEDDNEFTDEELQALVISDWEDL